jgi:glycosyltransferase involved in cell wall biosynthesis
LADYVSKTTSLKILFVNEYYPPYAPGGAEWSTHRWAQALTERGQRVVIATLNFGGLAYENADGIEIYRAPFPYKMRPGQGMPPAWLIDSVIFSAYFGWFVWRVARRTDADVIHSQSKGSLLGAWLAGRLLSRPVFQTVRDLGLLCPIGVCLLDQRTVPPDCGYPRLVTRDARRYQQIYLRRQHFLSRLNLIRNLTGSWLLTRARQRVMGQLAGIVFVSQGLLGIYPSSALRNRRLAQVIYNLPDLESHPPDAASLNALRAELDLAGKQIVLTVGKLSPGKGTPILFEAAAQMAARWTDILFLVVGKGQLRQAPPPNVQIMGSLPHETVQALYHLADVVVSPSVWPEPLSRVILEAMRAGKPVIGTAVGGTPELIENGVNGLLVPPSDATSLSQAITHLLQDESLKEGLSEMAKQRLETMLKTESLLAQLVSAYRQSLE